MTLNVIGTENVHSFVNNLCIIVSTAFYNSLIGYPFVYFHNQMMEDAVHFLSKETIVQAIARSATKVCEDGIYDS